MLLETLKAVYKAIRPKTRRELEEDYLSESKDLTDLERRIKKLENNNLTGWI